MSYYSKDQFEYSFALRTAYNYKYVKEEVKRRRAAGEKEEDYRLYEVTQLMNSFVGLLILPHENYFKNIRNDIYFEEGSEAYKLLNKVNNEHYDSYLIETSRNRYREKYPEEKAIDAKTFIKRIRDSVAHGKFSVYPESFHNHKNEITHLRFESSKSLKGYWTEGDTVFVVPRIGEPDFNETEIYREEYSIVLSIEEIEVLLFAICKELASCQPGGKENWPQELEEFMNHIN